MKFSLIVLLLAGVTGGTYLVLAGYTPIYASETKILRDKTYRFWECIQFKSFDQAAEFDSGEDHASTAKLIEQIFRIKPENLDIQHVHVLGVFRDGTGDLARTKTRLQVELLNPKQPRDIEVMLYWTRSEAGSWELELRSSL